MNGNTTDLQNILYDMYKSSIHTDVTLETKDGKTFKAHKLVLAMRSPVFADKFKGKHPSSLFTFTVQGISSNIMEIFLRYIYSDCLYSEKIEEIVDFGKAAKYYKINDVKPICKEALTKYIVNEQNVFPLLEASIYFRIKRLHSKCNAFIQDKWKTIFNGSEFLSVSQNTIIHVLNAINTIVPKTETMMIIFRWLNHNKKANRSILLNVNLESFTAENFLTWIEKFPFFLKPKEALNILLDLLKPGSIPLPAWYKPCFSQRPLEQSPVATAMVTDTAMVTAMVTDTALRVEIPFNMATLKASFFGTDGFFSSMRIKLKSYQSIQLRMMELSFGSSYVPEDALDINFFRHLTDFPLIRRIKVQSVLQATPKNYYILLGEEISLLSNSSLHFTLEIHVKGLKTWRSDEIVSDDRYRVMEVDKGWRTNLNLKETVCASFKLKSNSLVLLDLETGGKSFILESLYLETF